jgi:hypothetical protein
VRRLTAKYFGTFPHRVNIPAAIFKLTHNLISLQIKTFRSRVKKKTILEWCSRIIISHHHVEWQNNAILERSRRMMVSRR